MRSSSFVYFWKEAGPVVTENTIRVKFGGNICRRCINEEFGANLQQADCEYKIPFPQICPRCRNVANIVTGFRMTGRLKLLAK